MRALQVKVEVAPDLKAGDLPEALARTRAGILVVRSTEVTRAALAASPALSLVIRAGAGVNTIDLAAASELGIYVANCPGKNAVAVAELTMALILAADRRIPEAVTAMRSGQWAKKTFSRAEGLQGRTLGLVGFGAIAQEVARRALAFGLEVLAYTPSLTKERAAAHDVTRAETLAQLLAASDIVSVHCPYRKATTHHMIGAEQLQLMKPGALLVHTARGGVVDDAALARAVEAGHVRAALDVFEDEPSGSEGPFESPLRSLEGVYATPHIGASTEQAQLATALEVARIVQEYLENGSVPNVANVKRQRPEAWTLIVRHRDRVGVLAGVLGALREEQLNVQEMHNVIFEGNEAAAATITLAREPSEALVRSLLEREHILAVEVRARQR